MQVNPRWQLKTFLRRLRSRFARGRSSTKQQKVEMLWAIGVYEGPAVDRLRPYRGIRNPVLSAAEVTDVPADLVADPFVIRVDDRWHMFFEVLRSDTKRGEIACAESRDGLAWTYQRVVLAEPFHLSYPHVFTHDDRIYMTPECNATRSVRLYRARNFPFEWVLVKELVSGGRFSDPTPFRHGDGWSMFVETDPLAKYARLSLYQAPDLLGPWIEHPASPVIAADARRARPAGRVFRDRTGLVRFAQDCVPHYGSAVRAFAIASLSSAEYVETELRRSPILAGSGKGWNVRGMHHIDLHPGESGSLVAYVDGWKAREL